jgi:hypothetical protein
MAEKGIWDSVKEWSGDAWETVKGNAVDIIIASAPKVIAVLGTAVYNWFKNWR